jgi:hypothetical protein
VKEQWLVRGRFGVVLALLVVAVDTAGTVTAIAAAAIEETARPTRSAALPATFRCRRHVVDVAGTTVRLDGRRLSSRDGEAEIVVAPRWRRDCGAVAWVETSGSERRLVVVPSVVPSRGEATESLRWTLPPADGDERIFWVGRSRITVGVAVLKPRAIASWSGSSALRQ